MVSKTTPRILNALAVCTAVVAAYLLIPRCSLEGNGLDVEEARLRMVEEQIEKPTDGRIPVEGAAVLAAMRKVPRHLFVPQALRPSAYTDMALPIEESQSISRPYYVAFMTDVLDLQSDDRVLEIGTGSGYQAAILAEIVDEVFTIEIVDTLAAQASKRLSDMGYDNVRVRSGDGYLGWPEEAPFDAIIVTAAPNHVPQPLIDQLSLGGRVIMPQGDWAQQLVLRTKTADGIERQNFFPVQFVPMRRR